MRRETDMPPLFHGKMLMVDLSDGTLEEREVDDDIYARRIGGAPLISVLTKKDGISLGCGPLTGLPCPGASMAAACVDKDRKHRFAPVMLNAGQEIKLSGFDAIVVEGRSEKPVYLWIRDQVADLVSAEKLAGKDAWESISSIRHEQGDQRIQVISSSEGPSASLNFVSGWDGMGFGGAMRDMNLRAIAVRGMGEVPVENPEQVLARCSEMMKSSGKLIAGRGGIGSMAPHEIAGKIRTSGRNRACFSCPYPCMSFIETGYTAYPGMLLMDQKSVIHLAKNSAKDGDILTDLVELHRGGRCTWESPANVTYETMTDGVGEYDLIAAGYVLGICPRYLGLIQPSLQAYCELLSIALGTQISKEAVLSLGNCLMKEVC